MLMLVLYVGDEAFACDCEPIVEVVPLVNLKKLSQAPHYLTGLMNYGGVSIPVLDLSQIIRHTPSAEKMNTRIVVFKTSHPDAESPSHIGLIGEKITEIIDKDLSAFSMSALSFHSLPFLKGVLNTDKGSIQLLDINELFHALSLPEVQ